MSLMKTLAKVALGVAMAKGASGLMNKSRGGGSAQRQPGDSGLFGGLNSPQQQQAQASAGGGGLEDMLGALLGGSQASAQSGSSGGGLGGLLEQLSGGQSASGGSTGGGLNDLLAGLGAKGGSSGGGLSDLLTGLTGGNQSGGGGLGGMLGGSSIGGGESKKTASKKGGGASDKNTREVGFGEMLNQAIARQDEPPTPPSQDQEAVAALMLRAMIQAMKSDGEIDSAEQEKLLGRLGDVSPEERAFVQAEMRAPLDADGLARSVPPGLEQQVYTMSIMGIDLDSQNEAKYLHKLATGMRIAPQAVNNIHDQLGVQRIYS